MQEKRSYKRIDVNIPCVVFGLKEQEIDARIENMSEEGFLLVVKKEPGVIHPKKGDLISVQFTDTLKFKKANEEYVVTCEANVLRISDKESTMYIGCRINSTEYQTYVMTKKVIEYWEGLYAI